MMWLVRLNVTGRRFAPTPFRVVHSLHKHFLRALYQKVFHQPCQIRWAPAQRADLTKRIFPHSAARWTYCKVICSWSPLKGQGEAALSLARDKLLHLPSFTGLKTVRIHIFAQRDSAKIFVSTNNPWSEGQKYVYWRQMLPRSAFAHYSLSI